MSDLGDDWPRCTSCSNPFKPGSGRGPGGVVCSRNKCRHELYRQSDKAACVDQLEQRLREKDALIATQAELIKALQDQLRQRSGGAAQASAAHSTNAQLADVQPAVTQQVAERRPAAEEQRPAKKAKATDRAPLAQLADNGQQVGRAPPAKPPARSSYWDEAGRLPRGWTTQPSRSRPSQTTYVFAEFNVCMSEPPSFRKKTPAGSYCVQVELVSELLFKHKLEVGKAIATAELWRRIEKCLQMKADCISSSKSLCKHVRTVAEEATKDAAARWEQAYGIDALDDEDGADSGSEDGPSDSHAEEVGEIIRAATQPVARAERLDVRNLNPDKMDFSRLAALHGMR